MSVPELLDYGGCPVPPLFMERWLGARFLGSSAPYLEVRVRRGVMAWGWKAWDGEQFGKLTNHPIAQQWHPNWYPYSDWRALPGVAGVDLDQSFDKNGVTTATFQLDNARLVPAGDGHAIERGVYWPWRGYHPDTLPETRAKNEWYKFLPNAQIDVWQGYGSDTKVRTFTGLIDSYRLSGRPDRIEIVARDFGRTFLDTPLFGTGLPPDLLEPIVFMDKNDPTLKDPTATGPYIVVDDVVDVVKCVFRWAGFKEWEVEPSGVSLDASLSFDKSKKYIDIINQVRDALGYAFFMKEPTDDDLSIGIPVFRRPQVLTGIPAGEGITVTGSDLLTDFKPAHDNSQEKDTIRVFGQYEGVHDPATNTCVTREPNAWYNPPYIWRSATLANNLIYANLGDKGTIGFTTDQECLVAAILIAIQIAMAMDTATMQTPGQPAFGLDGAVTVDDPATGATSRIYITNRKSTMKVDGGGGELIWATEVGGALIDSEEMDQMVKDYNAACLLATRRQTVEGYPYIACDPLAAPDAEWQPPAGDPRSASGATQPPLDSNQPGCPQDTNVPAPRPNDGNAPNKWTDTNRLS